MRLAPDLTTRDLSDKSPEGLAAVGNVADVTTKEKFAN